MLTKEEIQKRILKNGNPLDLALFEWDKKTNTFSSADNFLVIDFSDIDNATITAGYNATITAGHNATITAGSYTTITARYNATITAGDDSVIVNRNIFEVIQTKNKVKICPYKIPGYLELIENKWYLNGDKSLGEHIIQDGILSKVVSKRRNIYRVINHGETNKSYLVTDGENWSHGKTLKEAKESLIYKISNRDTSKYKGIKLTTKYTLEEATKMYRVITGASEGGVKGFLTTIKPKKSYTVKEIIKLTTGQYGNDILIKFIKE